MTAPASTVQKLQKNLANGAPSTHDPSRPDATISAPTRKIFLFNFDLDRVLDAY
jgi:hypothetical protein